MICTFTEVNLKKPEKVAENKNSYILSSVNAVDLLMLNGIITLNTTFSFEIKMYKHILYPDMSDGRLPKPAGFILCMIFRT